jgi:DNA-directed RNA polymerase subunit F
LIAILAIQDAGVTGENTTVGPLGRTNADEAGLILRLNYGVAAVRMKKARVADRYYKHTFNIELLAERRQDREEIPVNQSACDLECQKFKTIYGIIDNMTQIMEASVSQVIYKIYQVVPDRDRRRMGGRRRVIKRGLFNFVGIVNHFLWGAATDQMVDDLRESVRQAKELAQTEAENVRRTKQELATVSRLQNSWLDNLRNVLDLERKSLVEIYDQVKSTRMKTAVEMDAIALLVQRITSYVSVHDDVQNLENGIDELIHQKLTTKLIPLSQMEVALAHANTNIQPLGAGLCYRTAQ